MLPLWWVALALSYLATTRTHSRWELTSTDLLWRFVVERGVSPGWALGGALVALCFVLAGGVLGVAALGHRLRADPHGVAGEAFHWGLKAPPRAWWFLLALWPLMAVATVFDTVALSLTVMLVTMVFAAAAPFLSGRREQLERSHDAWRVRWDWPGWPVFGSFIALLIAQLTLDAVIESAMARAAGWPDALRILLTVAWFIFAVWLSVWLGATRDGVWIDRAARGRPLRAQARAASRWRVIGPSLALQARWLWWSLMLVPPVMLGTYFQIYDAHSLQLNNAGYPLQLNRWMKAFTDGWWVLVAAFTLPTMLTSRRLWVVLNPAGPR